MFLPVLPGNSTGEIHHSVYLTMLLRSGSINRLIGDRRAQIIGMMVEGVSIRAITRMTGVSKNTIAKPLADVDDACLDYDSN
jgi:hypothetical protein